MEMKIYNLYPLRLLSLLILLILPSCISISSNPNNSSDKHSPKGWVVYDVENEILALNLETGKERSIHRAENWVMNISKGEKEVIYFDDCSGDCQIKKYNMNKNEVSVLFKGRTPTYIKEHKMLFFYRGRKLMYKNLGSNEKESSDTKIVDLENNYEITNRKGLYPLQISRNRILIVDQKDNIHVYNLSTGKSTVLDISKCLPLSWLKGRNEIICFNLENKNHEIVSLKTLQKRDLNIKVAVSSANVIYSPKYEALIYTSAPNWALWEYHYIYWTDLTTYETYRIGPGAVRSGYWVEELNLK